LRVYDVELTKKSYKKFKVEAEMAREAGQIALKDKEHEWRDYPPEIANIYVDLDGHGNPTKRARLIERRQTMTEKELREEEERIDKIIRDGDATVALCLTRQTSHRE